MGEVYYQFCCTSRMPIETDMLNASREICNQQSQNVVRDYAHSLENALPKNFHWFAWEKKMIVTRKILIWIGSIKDCQRTMTVSRWDKSLKNSETVIKKHPWTNGNGNQCGTMRISIKACWPRSMETAREVKLAPGSPESGKGGGFWCAISAYR